MKTLRFLVPMVGKAEVMALVLIGLLAVAAVGVPARLLDEASNRSLAEAIGNAPPPTGAVTVTQPVFLSRVDFRGSHRVASASGVLAAIDEATLEVMDEVRPFLADPFIHAETVRFRTSSVNGLDPDLPTLLTLRFQDGMVSDAGLVGGRIPSPEAPAVDGVPVVEIVMTEASMDQAGLDLGDELILQRDGADPAAFYVFSGATEIIARLVGMVAVPPAGDPVWAGDTSPVAGRVVDTHIGADVYITGFVTESQLPRMADIVPTSGMKAVAVFPLDPDRVGITEAGILEEAVRRLDAATRDTPSIGGDPAFRSGLPFVLGLERQRRLAVTAVLDVLRTGLFGLVAAVAFAIAKAFSDQRRNRSALNRGRGAVARDLLMATVLVVVPVSFVSALAAEWVLAGQWPRSFGWREPLVVTAVMAAGYLWAAWRPTGAPLPVLLGTARDGWRRYRAAGLIALPVVASVSIVSGRGEGRLGAVAPYLAAVAIAVLAERGLRSIVRVPGASTAIGGRIASRRDRSHGFVLPLAVGITVVVVASSVAVTLERAIDVAAWNQVLAPVRVELPVGGLPDELAGLPAVFISEQDIRLQSEIGTGSVALLLVDPRALMSVTAETPAEIILPDELFVDPADGLPLVVASAFGRRPAQPSDEFSLVGGGTANPALAVATLERFPSVRDGGLFAIANREHYEALVGPSPPPSVMLLAAADEAISDALVAAGATVTVRSEVAASLGAEPLVDGVLSTMRITLLMAAVLALGGVLAGLLAELAEARAVNAILTAVGARRLQRRLVATVAVLPAILAGVLAGALSWWITVRWLGDLVDFGPFAGTADRFGFQFDGLAVPVIGGLVGAVVLVWSLSGLLDRRSVATVLRTEGAV